MFCRQQILVRFERRRRLSGAIACYTFGFEAHCKSSGIASIIGSAESNHLHFAALLELRAISENLLWLDHRFELVGKCSDSICFASEAGTAFSMCSTTEYFAESATGCTRESIFSVVIPS